MDELLEALGVAIVEELFLEIGSGRPGARALSSVIATSRAVEVCIWPSLVGANCTHCEFGLGSASEKGANPKSLKPKPWGLGVNPRRSGVV